MAGIRVGTASVDFTPKPGLPLMGNFRDDYAARGVHDPLFAKSVVFRDPLGNKAALLAVDLCMLDRQNVALMRDVIRSGCDVPPENVLIHATHTHSGPATAGRLGMATEVAPFQGEIEALLTGAASAVVVADRALAETTLAVGYASEDRISFNRRLKRRGGSTQMNWEALQPGFDPKEVVEAWGPIDPQVACLVIEQEGVPATGVVSFALHPAILAGDNWLYSADYPGYLAEALARTLERGFHTLFLNGCCADVNHVDYRERGQGRGFQMAQRVGYMLAASAHQAINHRRPLQADPIRVSRKKVTLSRLKISPDEQNWCRQVIADSENQPPQGQVDGLPDVYYANLRLQMWEDQNHPDQAEVMVIRVGDLAMVGLPGEAFCQLGLEIKRRSPACHTLVAGLCNDAIGYLPTRQSFDQGGYETMTGSTFYEPGTGEKLVEAAMEQLNEVFQG